MPDFEASLNFGLFVKALGGAPHVDDERWRGPGHVTRDATTDATLGRASRILHAYGAPLPASYSCMDLGKGRIITSEAAAGGVSAPGERLAAVSIG